MESFADKALDTALTELASQRELFWQPQQKQLQRLPAQWRRAIERGEELLKQAQRKKIESAVSFPLL